LVIAGEGEVPVVAGEQQRNAVVGKQASPPASRLARMPRRRRRTRRTTRSPSASSTATHHTGVTYPQTARWARRTFWCPPATNAAAAGGPDLSYRRATRW
jgi:hypothetical protein